MAEIVGAVKELLGRGATGIALTDYFCLIGEVDGLASIKGIKRSLP